MGLFQHIAAEIRLGTSRLKKHHHDLDAKFHVQVKFICSFFLFFLVFSCCCQLLLLSLFKKAFDFVLDNAPTAIDSSVSSAIKKTNVTSPTKNFAQKEKNVEKNNYSKFNDEVAPVTSGSCLWPKFAYFSEQSTNFNMKKVSFPENSIIYVNQRYLKIKNNLPRNLCAFVF